MKLLQKRNQSGFTIIEVLIVLAIAGVIILGVLLAVPTLQRNNRNTARNNEASRVAALVNSCLANRNGITSSCNTVATIDYQTSAFQQLSTNPSFSSTTAYQAGTAGTDYTLNQTRIVFRATCLDDGSGPQDASTTSGSRSFAVLYQIETSGNPTTRCVGS
jgi:prepilin-type N-terminal cleavage/methylation domain-containing protein